MSVEAARGMESAESGAKGDQRLLKFYVLHTDEIMLLVLFIYDKVYVTYIYIYILKF